MSKTKMENDRRKEIIDWAIKYKLIINPSKGMEIYIQNILRFHHCPCDDSRPNCPCPQSINEVENNGHCRCRMYWRDLDTFKNTLKAGEENEESTSEKDATISR